MWRIALPIVLTGLVLCVPNPTIAQEPNGQGATANDRDESWYYQPSTTYQPNPQQIIHQKAMDRAAQRAARLKSMRWYGMSNARPVAAPTPFTSLYSPTWQMPGGRPFGWYTSGRPTVIFR